MKWFEIGIVALSISIGAYFGAAKHDLIASCLVALVVGLVIVGLTRMLLSELREK